jgi:hypothetical protein
LQEHLVMRMMRGLLLLQLVMVVHHMVRRLYGITGSIVVNDGPLHCTRQQVNTSVYQIARLIATFNMQSKIF